MPSVYAHYRFGTAMQEAMPADFRRTVRRFRRLYDVGLHGPDPLLYSRPLFEGRLAQAAEKVHNQTGREFFTRNCRVLRLEPSEAYAAYLYGVLCHYCLDTCCREILAQVPEYKSALEKAFDRLFLQKDGKDGALDYSRHLKLTAGEFATAAKCYPGITANQFRTALQCMACATRLSAAPESPVKQLTQKVTGIFRSSHKSPDEQAYLSVLPQLEAAYAQAEALFPQMLEQLTAHLTYNAPLKEIFSQPFS